MNETCRGFYPISPDARMWSGVKPDAPALVGRRAVA
jgi:hypothetical protein